MPFQYNDAYQSVHLHRAEYGLRAVIGESLPEYRDKYGFKVGISSVPLARVFGLGAKHAREGRDYLTEEREVGLMNRDYRKYNFTRLFALFESPDANSIRQAERRLIALGRELAPNACRNVAPGGEGRLSGSGPYFVYLATT